MSPMRLCLGLCVFGVINCLVLRLLFGHISEPVEPHTRLPNEGTQAIVVGSYNLWNTMFGWEVRRLHVADLVTEAAPDFIGVQEARLGELQGGAHKVDQMAGLKAILHEFRWGSFEAGYEVRPGLVEGVGILSRHPIVQRSAYNFSRHADEGPRTHQAVLHCVVDVKGAGHIHAFVVQFSPLRSRHCAHARELLSFIRKAAPGGRLVVMGDFRTHADYPGPMELLTQGSSKHCDSALNDPKGVTLSDAWALDRPEERGFTFSTIADLPPWTGMESRPDRILVGSVVTKTNKAHVLSATLKGQPELYKHKRSSAMLLRRAEAILMHLHGEDHEALHRGDHEDNGCFQDCGPRGVCACSVCVGNDIAAKLASDTAAMRFSIANSRVDMGDTSAGAELEAARHQLPDSIECAEFSWRGIGSMVMAMLAYCMVLLLWWIVTFCRFPWRFTNTGIGVGCLVVLMMCVCVGFAQTVMQGLGFAARLSMLVNGILHEEQFPSDHLMVLAHLQWTI